MRLIDADALEDYIDSDESGLLSAREYKHDYISCIDDMPTIDPVKHGHWICGELFEPPTCSACLKRPRTPGYCGTKEFYYTEFVHCPHCGAKMDEEE